MLTLLQYSFKKNKKAMPFFKNIVIAGNKKMQIALDIFFANENEKNPVVIYAHGFNGFKDWGNLDMMAAQFVQKGFTLVKFNFSHNGTSPENPMEFTDLQAFGNNNYTAQLEDLRLVIDWVSDPLNVHHGAIDEQRIYLIGHSMGGGIAILKARQDERIKKLVTWAAVSECKTPWGNWPEEKMHQWKTAGVQFYKNSRTGQELPLYYQLFEDYANNREALDIKKAISALSIPVLLCHGRQDNAVAVEKVYELKAVMPLAELFIVESDHVFGRKHPWTEDHLPEPMQQVLSKTLSFLR
jgi:uncharacterized protein